MNNKRSLRIVFLLLSVFVFIGLAGSTSVTQAQCGRPSTQPPNTSNSSGTSNSATTKPQGDMSNMDMSKMGGNMDMSGCPCPNCKSGGCANGSCSLENHIAGTNKSRTSATKRRSSRIQSKKKTP